jgi:hypothetical protein
VNTHIEAIDVGGPTAPPGTEGVGTILSWGAWGVSVVCVLGIFAVAAGWVAQHRRGGADGGENLSKLGWVLGAAILGAAAGPIVTTFIA